jgi:hypothetical protein
MVLWYVIETPCYPCSFKVTFGQDEGSNLWYHFFRTKEEAQKEADERNRKERLEDALKRRTD